MKGIGYYLNELKNWVKEGWKFLFEDTAKIEAHHLVAFLLTIAIIWLLSYIIAKIFKTVVKIVIMVALVWLLWMFLFDRSKYNELFSSKKGTSDNSNDN
jgi:MFS superfamily sulfate permease-like transporter